MKSIGRYLTILVLCAAAVGLMVTATNRGTSLKSSSTKSVGDTILSDPQPTVVATVNGDPIYEEDVLDIAGVIKDGYDPPPSDEDARQMALDLLIEQTVMLQEAESRGIPSDEEGGWKELYQIKQAAQNQTELQQSMEEQRLSKGMTQEEFDAYLVGQYTPRLRIEMLHDQLFSEVPEVTEEEIDTWLASQPGRNTLILISLHYTSALEANQAYADLQAAKDSQEPNEFVTTFDAYALQHSGKTSEEFVHEDHKYDEVTELLDYAQDAVGRDPTSMVLFTRPDDSAVIYYVLASETAEAADMRALAEPTLAREKREQFAEQYKDDLVAQADIQFFDW